EVGSTSSRIADYSVASGIFNVKLMQPLDAWEFFIRSALAEMKSKSRYGFSVNFMLPEPSTRPAHKMLYRSSPERWSTFCQTCLDCSVETIAGYGLREFTLLVRPRSADGQRAECAVSKSGSKNRASVARRSSSAR